MDLNIQDSTLKHQVTISIVAKNRANKALKSLKRTLFITTDFFKPIFHITTKCILLDYVGQTVNFGNEYHYPDNFIITNPNSEYHANINLNENYKFIPGKDEYYISIPNIFFSIVSENGKSIEFAATSNMITISIEGEKYNYNKQIL